MTKYKTQLVLSTENIYINNTKLNYLCHNFIHEVYRNSEIDWKNNTKL